MSHNPPEADAPTDEQVPQGWLHLAALSGLALVGLYLCYRLAEPFLPALAWAVALAIIAFPMHRRLARVIPYPSWSAGISTTVVVVVLVIPGLLIAARLADEAAAGQQKAREVIQGGWRQTVESVPYLKPLTTWAEQHVNPEAEARRLVGQLSQGIGGIVQGSIWALFQVLVMVFILFFAFRDTDHLLNGLRRLLPVTRPEADHLFARTADSVYATVYATVVTGLIQGVTGGLLFWALGIPAALLWGVVMALLGILPILGTFLVWIPAAIVLGADGRVGAATLIVVWGLVMAGPVGNWLYGYLAGGRLRIHPVPALLAYLGGLAVFGLSGMVLGPLILAITLALIEMLRRRAGPTLP